MSLSSGSRTGLQKLVGLVVNNKDMSIDYTKFPAMIQRRIPDDPKFEKLQGVFLLIVDREFQQYRECLDSLSGEPDLECMSRKEIDTELWHLVCEAYVDAGKFKSSAAIKERVASFEADLLKITKPIKKYEVLIPIQGLKLKSGTVQISDVKLVQVSDEVAKEWNLTKGGTAPQDLLYDAFISNGAAIIPEKGNDPQKAIDRARARLLTVLDFLRTALLLDHDPRIISFKIHDEEMLFEPGENVALREVEDSELLAANWHRGFRMMDLTLDGLLETQVSKSMESLDDLAKAVGEAGKGVGVRFIRAVQWIGSSVTRERTDDKIVDLCTALEAFLSTKDSGLKGEIIALRTMLLPMVLDKPFFDPAIVLALYEKRSDVIHGSEKGVCTDWEYIALRTRTAQTLKDALTLVKAENITKYTDFLKRLHSDPDLVGKAVQWWQGHPSYKDICKAADDCSKSMNPQPLK